MNMEGPNKAPRDIFGSLDIVKNYAQYAHLSEEEIQGARDDVRQALSRLREKDRNILTAYILENQSLEEIAENRGIGVQKTKSLKDGALTRLIRMLDDDVRKS